MRWQPLLAGAALLILAGSCARAPVPSSPQGRPLASPAPRPLPPVADTRFVYDGALIQGGAVLARAPAGTTALTLDEEPVDLAPDGRFLIAFDRDAKPQAELVATLGSGAQVRQALTVAPRAWAIERLNTLPRFAQPQPEFQRRRAPELAAINAARRVRSTSEGWRQRFLWPAVGRVSGLFGAQRVYRGEPGSYHSGVDVAQPTGTPVLAPADGQVILATAAPYTLEGNLLMVDHGMGLNSAFMHLSRIDVRVGETVRRGQRIGAIGASGRATGPHLHWGMKWRDRRIDPLLLAGPMPAAE